MSPFVGSVFQFAFSFGLKERRDRIVYSARFRALEARIGSTIEAL
jgi:hypothetical protein